jgi:hypothetical protein
LEGKAGLAVESERHSAVRRGDDSEFHCCLVRSARTAREQHAKRRDRRNGEPIGEQRVLDRQQMEREEREWPVWADHQVIAPGRAQCAHVVPVEAEDVLAGRHQGCGSFPAHQSCTRRLLDSVPYGRDEWCQAVEKE